MNFVEELYEKYPEWFMESDLVKDINRKYLEILKVDGFTRVDAGGVLVETKFPKTFVHIGNFNVESIQPSEKGGWKTLPASESTDEILRKYMLKTYGESYLQAFRDWRNKQKTKMVRDFDRETDRIIEKLVKLSEQVLDENREQGVTQ